MIASRTGKSTKRLTHKFTGTLLLCQLDLAHATLANRLYERVVTRRSGNDSPILAVLGARGAMAPCIGGLAVVSFFGWAAIVCRR